MVTRFVEQSQMVRGFRSEEGGNDVFFVLFTRTYYFTRVGCFPFFS